MGATTGVGLDGWALGAAALGATLTAASDAAGMTEGTSGSCAGDEADASTGEDATADSAAAGSGEPG